jgi:hypothetical protein
MHVLTFLSLHAELEHAPEMREAFSRALRSQRGFSR